MGLLNKLVLVFPSVFWDKQSDFILREMEDRSGLWSVFLNYNKALGMPVLVALNAAETAQGLESMTDQEVVEGAMKVRGWEGVGGRARGEGRERESYATSSCNGLQRGIVGRVSWCKDYTEPLPCGWVGHLRTQAFEMVLP